MFNKKRYKYDIAISVAEEDLDIAYQITDALSNKNILYYLYTENRADNWGKHLMKISLDTYKSEAKYLLVITSNIFAQKYWGNIERQMAQALRKSESAYILQLKLDNTPIDGISSSVVAETWDNNPEEIATILEEKLRTRKGQNTIPFYRNHILTGSLIAVCILIAGIYIKQPLSTPLSTPFSGYPGMEQKVKPSPTGSTDTTLYLNDFSITCACFTATSFFLPSGIDTPVKLSEFCISKNEVTMKEYTQFCRIVNRPLPPIPDFGFLDLYPVVNISWYEADAYCKWIGGRLPSETEWLYAAGITNGTKYSGGNNAQTAGLYNRKKPVSIDNKNYMNNFGIFNMSGNVAEWCSDWYEKNSGQKLVYGGSYNSTTAQELNIRKRIGIDPSSKRPDIGFRVVWDR
jgi:formylglycine-generating enzyme